REPARVPRRGAEGSEDLRRLRPRDGPARRVRLGPRRDGVRVVLERASRAESRGLKGHARAADAVDRPADGARRGRPGVRRGLEAGAPTAEVTAAASLVYRRALP